MRIEGHRGLGSFEPENTLQAFARAIDEGLDGIELDVANLQHNPRLSSLQVWLTTDKVPIVIHSHSVDGNAGYVDFDDGIKSNHFAAI